MKGRQDIALCFGRSASVGIAHGLVQIIRCTIKLLVELIEIAQLPQCFGTVGVVFAKALCGRLQQRNNVFFVGIIAQTMRDMESSVGNRQRIIGG